MSVVKSDQSSRYSHSTTKATENVESKIYTDAELPLPVPNRPVSKVPIPCNLYIIIK